MESITVEALRARLEKGEKVSVLDVRSKKDFDAWRVPGAFHCAAEDDLAAGRPGAVKSFELLPREHPVVVADTTGKLAHVAAQVLSERGFRASALVGGMEAWSLAWNVAEVPTPGGEATILQVRRTGKGCLSYVIGAGDECVVVDPSVDVAVYRDIARQHGWTIRHILETHVHADHMSRAHKLASLTHARIHVPRNPRVTAHVTDHVDEGWTLRFGGAQIVAMRTPGHAPESTSYLVGKHALLTGDALFLESVPRLDLESDKSQGRKRAMDMHASATRILALPPDTFLLPGHSAGPVPFDQRPIVGTVRQVRERVPLYVQKRDEFVERLVRDLPAVSSIERAIATANETGQYATLDPSVEAGPHRSSSGLR